MRNNAWAALIIAFGIIGWAMMSAALFVTVETPDGEVVEGNLFTLAEGTNITITGDDATNTITIAATSSGQADAFSVIDVPRGTDPTATGPTTLTVFEGANIAITGSAVDNSVTVGLTGTVVSGYLAAFPQSIGTPFVTPGWGCRDIAATLHTAVTNNLLATPILVPETTAYTSIIVDVAVASTVGTTMRLGIYEAQPNSDGWEPGTLLLDAGTVNVGTTGVKSIAINQELLGGTIYYLASVTNSSANLQLNGCSNNTVWSRFDGLGEINTDPLSSVGFMVTGVGTGALPNPFPAANDVALIEHATQKRLGF